MKAVWYERFGPAREVLIHGEMPTPGPAAGEVLIRVRASGINPSDMMLRAGARPGGVIAAYASASRQVPGLQFYPLMFRNVTLHILAVYRLTPEVHAMGAAQLAKWRAAGQKLGTVVVEV